MKTQKFIVRNLSLFQFFKATSYIISCFIISESKELKKFLTVENNLKNSISVKLELSLKY